MSLNSIRSIMFTPALNYKNYNQAELAGADVCVIDLEDSIPKSKKIKARQLAKSFFESDNSAIITALRINDLKTLDGIKDLSYISTLKVKPKIIFIPKVHSKNEITLIRQVLSSANIKIAIFAIIETPQAISKIMKIARVCDGLIFGSADYAANLCIDIKWENMLYARSQILVAAAQSNIIALDSACYELNNIELLQDESILVKSMGFVGKAAMNSKQVKIINQIFSIDPDEIKFAQKIADTYEKSNAGIITINGNMVGPPFVEKARKILARYDNVSFSNHQEE